MMKKAIYFIVVLLMGFLATVSLFHAGLPMTHDGQDHVARIANFYTNLEEGVFIPRWAANLNWGYGHPILEFLYPLPSYIASLLHFGGVSLVDSFKTVLIFGMIFSGISMYLWLSEFLPLESSVIGAVLYIYAPYRFVNVYVRGDIGENLAFIFVPLVMYFLLRIFKEKRYALIGASLSISGLILAHNAMALMFLPFILYYGFYLIWISGARKSLLIKYACVILVGFGLSAFFWVPGLLEGKFTLRDIVTRGVYKDSFVTLGRLIYGPWSYGGNGQFTVQLGILHWIFGILSIGLIYKYFKQKKSEVVLISGVMIILLVAVFLMLPASGQIYRHVMILQNFQFVWRFLAVVVFCSSVLAALVWRDFFVRFRWFGVLVFLFVVFFINKDYMHARGFVQKSDSFFTGIYDGTTDTGESAPVWSVRFMEKRPKHHLDVIDGKAIIGEVSRNTVDHYYLVDTFTKTRFVENTLYFPGWHVLVDGVDTAIQFQDPRYRGLMTFYVPSGRHKIELIYKDTKLRAIADMVSWVSYVILILVFGFIYVTRKKLGRISV